MKSLCVEKSFLILKLFNLTLGNYSLTFSSLFLHDPIDVLATQTRKSKGQQGKHAMGNGNDQGHQGNAALKC